MWRADEHSSEQWPRSDRIFSTGGQWYFQTREGIAVGPYSSRDSAVGEVALFARVHRRARRAARD